ncbi:recombinase family protein [Ammoniphilus sp. CFH 90114]|uniref:recombinase family protein n=1 Tax=Ammoniphilus sp. CFH 90114 TaxID=2493665 RepID=UPI00100E55C4|nr:recombinase family protein [Ammoniphilus sp. CFH 90114]RXT08929.1 recombinase family protein [Ammoniphilus sp. CFH 90114]
MTKYIESSIALYYRVSTSSQNDDMQIGANQSYLEKMAVKEFIELNDHGVSALKNELHKRPKLVELLELIKAGQIKTVIVYARDRLSRDMYEYSSIVQIFYDYKVEVIFTMENHTSFQQTKDMELLAFLFCDQEGRNLQQRTKDRNKRNPYAIFGYKKIKDGSNKDFYKIKLEEKDRLVNLFNLCLKAQTPKDMLDYLEKQKKLFKKPNVFEILKILQNPFYSGHCEEEYGFQSLLHVESVVSLEMFLNVRTKLNHFSKDIFEAMNDNPVVQAYCAVCNQQMKIKGKSLTSAGYFLCKNNHSRVTIHVEELDKLLKEAMVNHFNSMATGKLKKITRASVIKLINEIEASITKIHNEIKEESINLSLSFAPNKSNPLVLHKFQLIKELKSQIRRLSVKKYQLNLTLSDIDLLHQEVHKKVIEGCLKTNLRKLANLVVDKVEISNGNVMFHFFFKEFIQHQGK